MEVEFTDPRAPHSIPTMLNPSKDKRSTIELIGKLILSLVVIALLAAILIVLIVRSPTNNNTNTQVSSQVITSFSRIVSLNIILFRHKSNKKQQ